tara:strand:+ start:2973 stop:3521 length:549 start_codon:yes stop_codon:yes gene_type:complete
MNLQNLSFLFLIICILSCKKIDTQGYRVYKIKSGRHRSNTAYCTTKSNYITFEAIFDESAQYTSIDPINQYDVNKLYGLSDNGTSHTKNSIRFGWRWLNDSLEILWFKHEDGDFSFGNITTIDLNTSYQYSITFTEDSYILIVDGVEVEIDRKHSGTYRKYYLYPYFGGDEKAPHNITIRIK